MRTIEELRELANEMNKSLEELLYEMLNDATNENERYKMTIDRISELLQLLHYRFCDYDSIHNDIEDIQKILKWVE